MMQILIYNLGIAYGKSGMYKEAIESYKQAIRINPGDANTHRGLGDAFIGTGMHKEAIESYKQAVRIDPDWRNLLIYNLGVAYDNSGMYKEAIESYKQAIRINPDDAIRLILISVLPILQIRHA